MTEQTTCIIVDDEPVAREILETHLSKIKSIKLIASCSNAIEAFNIINAHAIDLIFLDINMPEVSGLSFAKSINEKIKVIFTTAYREYAVDGFDLLAVDYLLKPISYERLLKSISKYFKIYSHQNASNTEKVDDLPKQFMFVRSERKMIKINFNDIKYIESLGDYLQIYTTNKTIITRETISNIEVKLPGKDFLRIHRSFIVSYLFIASYTNEWVEIDTKALPISRSFKAAVLKKLESL
ncbi:response regulator [Flavobacteriaceae bacterium R38]|nr:response regulator [Flavobacteriaceae bacterium R38]